MSNDLTAFFGGAAFVPDQHEAATDFDTYPPGKYPVLIEAAEVKPNNAKTGHILKLTMQILDGVFKGRTLYDNINLENPSEKCVEIGMRTFTALGQALGLPAITNTDQLLKGIVVAHVKVKNEQNNVRTYSVAGQQTAAPATPPSPLQEPGYTESSRAAVDPRGAGGSANALPRQSAFAAAHPSGVPPMGPPETYGNPQPPAPVATEQTPQGLTAPSAPKAPWQ